MSVEPHRPGTLRVLTIDQKNLDRMVELAREIVRYPDPFRNDDADADAQQLARGFLWLTGMPR